MTEPDDQEIKSLFGSIPEPDDSTLESQRRTALARVKFNVAKQDAFALSMVKIWVALAEALAPLFAFFVKKQNTPPSKETPKKHNEPLNKSE